MHPYKEAGKQEQNFVKKKVKISNLLTLSFALFRVILSEMIFHQNDDKIKRLTISCKA